MLPKKRRWKLTESLGHSLVGKFMPLEKRFVVWKGYSENRVEFE